MIKLTEKNRLVLPDKLEREAPTCWDSELWFDKEYDAYSDLNCEQALIAKGIGEHRCPTAGIWVSFAVAGGIIAALTKKYIVPPDPERLDWIENLQHFTWEVLWKTFQDNPGLDSAFREAVLRSFLPREHRTLLESWRMSNFVLHWGVDGLLQCPDTTHPIGNVRLQCLEKGHKAFGSLSQGIRDSIRQVSQYVPPMLEITIQQQIFKT